MCRQSQAAVSLLLAMGLIAEAAGQASPSGSLLEQCPALRIDISLGRFRATNLRLGANRNFSAEHRNGNRYETLVVNVATTSPTVHYEIEDGDSRIIWDVTPETALLRQIRGSTEPKELLVVRQPVRGPLTLRLCRCANGDDDNFDDYQG